MIRTPINLLLTWYECQGQNWPSLPKELPTDSLISCPIPALTVLLEGIKSCGNLEQWIGPVHPMATVALHQAMGVTSFMVSFYWAKYRKYHCIKTQAQLLCKPSQPFRQEFPGWLHIWEMPILSCHLWFIRSRNFISPVHIVISLFRC